VGRWFERGNDGITTVHLGQFTRETGNEIAGALEEAGIVWWYKEPGFLAQVWEYGVRLFVDEARLPEAREIADRVVARRTAVVERRAAAARGERPPERPPGQAPAGEPPEGEP
jgi:hypothetical protein